MKTIVLFLLTVAVVAAKTSHYYPSPYSNYYVPKPYRFKYAVNDQPSGNDYGHEEESDGNVITGTYFVLLPDGRRQVVHYRAGHFGYTADVTYEGEPKAYSPRPAVEQPRNNVPTISHYPKPYYYLTNPLYSYPVNPRPAFQAYSVQNHQEEVKSSETSKTVNQNVEVSLGDVAATEVSIEPTKEQVSIIDNRNQVTASPEEQVTEQAQVIDGDVELITEDLIALTEVPAGNKFTFHAAIASNC